ncbi:MAG: DNA mismatch repair endonuclease MutL [Candidatus Dormibacteria bacterium]
MSIARLDQAVADAIAAGEVVERPASVVKELVENAVDAGARRLDTVIDGAGTVRIRVSDDGAGIAADELTLAVARHATSKIRRAADLEAVATLGFRGEALASIAAVSDLVLTSRVAGAAAGARLRVRHGEVAEMAACAAPPGTTVEVRDLFAATPARLRFLRAERTEVAAALAVLTDLVLVRPHLAVSCRIDGRVRLQSRGGSLDDALSCVFGADAAQLLPVDAEGDINVGGAISQPQRHRGTRGGLVVVVNGRVVENRSLGAAVSDAYRGLVPSGRHPFGVVSIELDPAEVDVNVHPTKREVRFRKERDVYAAVQRACWEALRHASVYAAPALLAATSAPMAAAGVRLGDGDAGWLPQGGTARAVAAAGDGAPGARPPATAATLAGGGGAPDPSGVAALSPLVALGQHEGRWMVAGSPRGLVLVDPHAAHEKVVYTELLESWSRGATATQLLLLPALVECDAARLQRFGEHEDLVASCGFVVDPFGPATLRVTAVPARAAAADAGRLLLDLLDALAGGPVSEQRHRAAALVACHSAVRFGDALPPAAQQELLDRLAATPGGLTCPHGRPAVTLLDEEWLRRTFHRPRG